MTTTSDTHRVYRVGRRSFWGHGLALLLGAGMVPEAVVGATATPSPRATSDIQMLRTAAALENVLIGAYTNPAAQSLIVATENRFLVAMVTRSVEQHGDHARALNASIQALGGAAQRHTDSAVADGMVAPALSRAGGAAGILSLAADLEDLCAQTHIVFAGAAEQARTRAALARIAPVEAQHAAILGAVLGLVAGGLPLEAITLPPAASLSFAGGPPELVDGLYPVARARPPSEGAGS